MMTKVCLALCVVFAGIAPVSAQRSTLPQLSLRYYPAGALSVGLRLYGGEAQFEAARHAWQTYVDAHNNPAGHDMRRQEGVLSFEAVIDDAATISHFVRHTSEDLAPLRAGLQSADLAQLNVSVVLPPATIQTVAIDGEPPDHTVRDFFGTEFNTTWDLSEPAPTLSVAYGYDVRTIVLMVLPFFALGLLPLLGVFSLRFYAAFDPREGVPGSSQKYGTGYTVMMYAVWIVCFLWYFRYEPLAWLYYGGAFLAHYNLVVAATVLCIVPAMPLILARERLFPVFSHDPSAAWPRSTLLLQGFWQNLFPASCMLALIILQGQDPNTHPLWWLEEDNFQVLISVAVFAGGYLFSRWAFERSIAKPGAAGAT